MEILFEDGYIIVCIKPCGVLSQSDSRGGESMITLLEEKSSTSVYPLHRLDREVGGIMVYAKTKFAAAVLSKDIADNNFKKEYLALVHGAPQTPDGEMEDFLFKDSSKNKVFVVKKERKGVKKASLEYTTLCTKEYLGKNLSVVKILLHTGRTHQIRVQFASRKMSLIGDRKYGARDSFKEIGLWSYKLTFNHPKTKEKLSFCAEPQNIIKNFLTNN